MNAANTSWQHDNNFSIPRLLGHAAATPSPHLFDDPSRPLLVGMAVIVFALPIILIRQNPQRLVWWCWSVGAVGGLAVWDALRHTLLMDFARFSFLATPGFCVLAVAPLPLAGWRA
jgi:hypothetical protein